MNKLYLSALALLASAPAWALPVDNAAPKAPAPPTLHQVAQFAGAQVTGITVANDGRLFANFPRWRDGVPFSVVEVHKDGTYKPYPDASWNTWAGAPRENTFTCVQSVVAHGHSLFVLDPASPLLKGVVGQAALYEFSLNTDQLLHKWAFPAKIAPPLSYLNDLRIDDAKGKIYITDSGLGALVVLDPKTGAMNRVLEDDSTTKSEPIVLTNDGKPMVDENGAPRRFNVDGIALYKNYLYYHAVTGRHLYRVPTSALAEAKSAKVKSAVEDLGETPLPDGMIFDKAGNLYMADLEHNAVVYRTPAGKIETLVKDPNLHWADTLALDPNGNLLFSDSKLGEAGPGQPAAGMNFPIYSVPLPSSHK